jgi:predicted GIY-YIG superfamily endonuclease
VGAHCIHELWMRRDLAVDVDRALEELWKRAAKSIPDWLPMRDIEWLPLVYEVSARFRANSSGRTNVYLVLLDYRDSRADPHALYVGMSRYSAHQRFDQHKAGIRAAGSVLRRGLEVLTGPTAHLRNIARNEAVRIEAELAEALRQEGLFVQGGH